MPPAPQAPWSQQSHAVGNPASPCGVESCIHSGTGGAEVENLLIMFVQDVLATGKHLPGFVDLIFGIEIDTGISIYLAGLAGTAEALGNGKNAGFDQPLLCRRDAER